MLETRFWSRDFHILCRLVPSLGGMGHIMELRHLRYFVAVAEEGSLTVAAERRLHTSQPSLSRQIRDLEYEVGAQLMIRSARGIELTAAGRVFLDHARLALAQVEAAGEAARRAAQPAKPSFALVRGKLDVAFLRPETQTTNLVFKLLTKEPLVVVLPSDHRLASHEAINPQDIAGETFISVSNTAPVLRVVIDDYLRRSGIEIKPDHEVDHLAMAVSLVASTRGVALLPAYARNLLPRSVISRPLRGDVPTIDLVVGYSKTNTSPILKLFLSRIDDLIARVSKKTH